MGFFHEDIAVDLATELAGIDTNSTPARTDNGLYYVRELDLWFRYDVAGTPSGDDITPTDNIGAFKVGASGSGGGGGGSTIISGTANPIGSVTPNQVDDVYIWEPVPSSTDGEKKVYYKATGLTNNDWEAFGGTAEIWIDNPLTGDADFLGQLAFEVSSASTTYPVSARYVSTQVGTGGNDWSQIF